MAIASTYPLGSVVTISGKRWDARAAVVNSAPTRSSVLGGDDQPRATAVFEAGAGITPRAGLRLGVSVSRGSYLTKSEAPIAGSRIMTMITGEGQFAFRPHQAQRRVCSRPIGNRISASGSHRLVRAGPA